MRFGSLDTFLMEDRFWQDKMGKPVANQEFLHALLRYGTLESYHFFCPDTNSKRRFQAQFEKQLPTDLRNRVKVSLQANFLDHLENVHLDFIHQGDFTYHMPYLMELRNHLGLPLPISGVTHSLDGAWMQTRFIQLLLSNPKHCDCIVCSSNCAKQLLTQAFSNIRETFVESFGGSPSGASGNGADSARTVGSGISVNGSAAMPGSTRDSGTSILLYFLWPGFRLATKWTSRRCLK